MKSLSLDTSEKFKSSSLLVTHPQRQSEDICTFKNCSQLCTIVNNEATCMCQTSYRRFPDEFSCVKVNSCKYNPCGAGICELLSSRHYVCRCPSGFEGLHCEVQIGLVELANNTGTVVAVVIILLAILGIVIGVTWYKNQPFFIWKAKGRRANQTYRFSNPAFGVLSDTAIMTNSPAPSSSASIDAPPYRGVNPQKSHSNFENPFFKADDHQANTSLDSAVVSGTDSTSISIAPHQINLESPNVMQEQSTNEKKEWILSPYNPPPLESGAHTNL
ncbi:hypothetical protein SK128_026609 [Halocaridina rubra]|uniref:EGF-like domain-containing protein n=1 Tax=Halocaridina rubra TaxID=373956 RepID=A0AAN8WKN6_HALRR